MKTIKIGSGFTVDNVTIFAAHASVKGRFVRNVGSVPNLEQQLGFDITLEEAQQFKPGTTYDLVLTEQVPDTRAIRPSAPPSST